MSGWSIVYIEGLIYNFLQKYCNYFSEDLFCSRANSDAPDEMPQNAAFHLCLHCFVIVPIMGFLAYRGLKQTDFAFL